MKKTLICMACAAALAGCASMDGLRAGHGGRVPANPADFTAAAPTKPDESQAMAAERDNLAQTIAQLRGEVAQLRQLFRLQNAPLEGDRRRPTGDVFAPVAKAPAQPVVQAATAPLAQRPAAPVAAPAPVQVAQALPVAPAPITRETTAQPAAKPVAQAAPAAAYTALFKFGSAALDDTSRAALAAIRPQLASAQKVSLNAYADTVGDAGANAKLALARASAIEQELVKLGVPKERIEVSAKVVDSKPPQGATILGLFRAPDAMSRRVDLALLSPQVVQ